MAALAYAALAVVAGALLAAQAAINARLGRVVGGPIPATLVSFTVGWVALSILTVATTRDWPSLAALRQTPPWLFVAGGLLGASYLTASVFLVPRIGAGAALCLAITGQVLASVLLDSQGWFGLAVRSLTVWRATGAILVAMGAVMVRFL
jgi:bacterial/archaeal transporter family-2 protein